MYEVIMPVEKVLGPGDAMITRCRDCLRYDHGICRMTDLQMEKDGYCSLGEQDTHETCTMLESRDHLLCSVCMARFPWPGIAYPSFCPMCGRKVV